MRTLLIVLAVAPPLLAGVWWLWMRGGLWDAADLVVALGAVVSALVGIHFAIKRNLGY